MDTGCQRARNRNGVADRFVFRIRIAGGYRNAGIS